jgi:exocyst complex component 4
MDYDPLVVKLNKDISAIEEAMSVSLQQHKFQYIFEGQTLLLSLGAWEEGRVKVY